MVLNTISVQQENGVEHHLVVKWKWYGVEHHFSVQKINGVEHHLVVK